uniref:Secreted protein n=1 Tax=Cacopsylla melanoneura TaxID=428564 RepID=A0A8D8SZT4_9HEMI
MRRHAVLAVLLLSDRTLFQNVGGRMHLSLSLLRRRRRCVLARARVRGSLPGLSEPRLFHVAPLPGRLWRDGPGSETGQPAAAVSGRVQEVAAVVAQSRHS